MKDKINSKREHFSRDFLLKLTDEEVCLLYSWSHAADYTDHLMVDTEELAIMRAESTSCVINIMNEYFRRFYPCTVAGQLHEWQFNIRHVEGRREAVRICKHCERDMSDMYFAGEEPKHYLKGNR